MSEEITVREARPTDARELAALATELGYPSTEADVARRLPFLLSDPGHLLRGGADENDRAVAWLHAVVRRELVNDGFVQVAGLVVAAGHRSTGIGSRLLGAGERWALEAGVPAVRLRSNVVRARAHGFYLRAGYTLSKTSHLFVKQLA